MEHPIRVSAAVQHPRAARDGNQCSHRVICRAHGKPGSGGHFPFLYVPQLPAGREQQPPCPGLRFRCPFHLHGVGPGDEPGRARPSMGGADRPPGCCRGEHLQDVAHRPGRAVPVLTAIARGPECRSPRREDVAPAARTVSLPAPFLTRRPTGGLATVRAMGCTRHLSRAAPCRAGRCLRHQVLLRGTVGRRRPIGRARQPCMQAMRATSTGRGARVRDRGQPSGDMARFVPAYIPRGGALFESHRAEG